MQDTGLGMDLVGKLWGLPCWTVAPTGECERQGWIQTRLVKAAVPTGNVCGLGLGLGQTVIGSINHWHLQDPERV